MDIPHNLLGDRGWIAEHCPCTFLAIIILYERYFAYMKTVYHPAAVRHAKEEDR